jgi:nicotinamide-nucleotide amidase
MRLEVLNTGSELLLGSVLNTHVRLFAEALFPLGLRIARQTTVGDGEPIRIALAEIVQRTDIVLITGGLGPTTDDVTREAVADLFGLKMIHDPAVMTAIEARFARRNLQMSARNARQAERPPEATVLVNPFGTAPGLYLPPLAEKGVAGKASPHLFLLPGPPRELRPMVADSVIPMLRKILPPQPEVVMRVLRIGGVGESLVEERAGERLLALGLELGYCARPGEVDVRLIGDPATVAKAEAIVRAEFTTHLFSDDARELEAIVIQRLTALGETLATAESCTGGGLANRLTNVPGASAVFLQGFVTYANEAKTRALDVDSALIAAHGAVSREVAQAMAEGARRVAGTDHALATTGIAGPGGGTPEKPVGTVFIALATKNGPTIVQPQKFPTDRETFKQLTIQTALDLLRRTLGMA